MWQTEPKKDAQRTKMYELFHDTAKRLLTGQKLNIQ